ncbi:o-sialoglycoprotein endopeptidase [Thiobacillus denitrificans ATCC 25259]|uniref:tRNA N6-adenosine threonylcarbamoyltransferase n=1 Tax=Thiobacillus denitrificans (strain ATCC 25259 / T1) TaxID=292415 RepID=TSAD_THIDA|nr:tRNA (adenosine(37)-N6)-threonylcarbamoyltransferase complex transferase subunit TsaD [Thiobacillus denitrificans]Q3SGB3.1 RecName: Full=tRNA N6-adenosine threonylcarbamoyltransferase; AltName: Full=N6-L-threonylcarbamoyladenine synthase; Short=t(6)A synthase; AltName: Full=t(6)A37 threonylcarbamoyladenosine biosynthesis protein TsaD; AltName: Full=tRNA threonylcarbamoyladenosine biosynthesis protein TsaD [Thiobacillus denitrificans ATCC 25259]AAZ98337.1 o-sialoglycoprotein endopeptidase [Thio
MLVLGIESSCDETGVALYDSAEGLVAHALHSQIAMHNAYGGVVPELASRDHIRRILPLTRQVFEESGRLLSELGGVAFTQGPGLAGALLVGAGMGRALAFALRVPAIGVHHLEGHLLSPLISDTPPAFPFVALLVSGGHTQLMLVSAVGQYTLLGETLDDAAGEAFDKTAQLLGLGYPGGPALSRLAAAGDATRFALPRPMLNSGDFDFSFSGLKTAVLTLVRKQGLGQAADIAAAFEAAAVDVLVGKSLAACRHAAANRLVVAGGVGANARLRERLTAEGGRAGVSVFYPSLEFCTDNGAMIAFAGAQRLASVADRVARASDLDFAVKPRWALASLGPVE